MENAEEKLRNVEDIMKRSYWVLGENEPKVVFEDIMADNFPVWWEKKMPQNLRSLIVPMHNKYCFIDSKIFYCA